LQAAYAQLSGRKTVPMVFIGGSCLGGCDETVAAIHDGSIKGKLAAAGVSIGGGA
jgi:glutaredoxin